MPKKSPKASDWQPIDLLHEGRAIYASLPCRQIEQQLAATFPNWQSLDDGARNAVRTVVLDAFCFSS